LQAHPVEQPDALVAHLGVRNHPVQPEQSGEHRPHADPGVERGVGILEDHLHAPRALPAVGTLSQSGFMNFSAGRLQRADEDFRQRRLA
jgi:hypothetical protein